MSIISKIKTIWKLMVDADYRLYVLVSSGYKKNVPSEEVLKRTYRYMFGRDLNLQEPILYTEKLQWLKLYDHRPEYVRMVDKYEVKDYVAEIIGAEYVIPLLGVWNCVEDIDFNQLPTQFVLKTTHDSGGIVLCKNKDTLDIPKTRKKLQRLLNRDYYSCNREWPYKKVPRRIIAEEYMEDPHHQELRDYKFFTFDGVPKVLYIAQGRGRGEQTYADFFDMEFQHLPFTIDHDMAPERPEKPVNFELMKDLAAKLSAGTPQLRVDFYEMDGRVYFGEMTFFHCSGMAPFHPQQWDQTFGEWLTLPPKRTEEIL